MKYLFSVLDRVSGVFAPPFVALSSGAAKRQFSEAVNTADPNNQLHKYHDDFGLVCLGEFDEISGSLVPTSKPEYICGGADVFRPVPAAPVPQVSEPAKPEEEPELPL